MFLKRCFSGTRFRNIWIIIRPIFCCLLYLDTPFPKNFQSVVKNIFKRLFRVFVHVYIHHFEKIVNLGAVSVLTVLCLILYALQFSCVAHSFKLFNDMKSFFEIFQCVLNFLLFFFPKNFNSFPFFAYSIVFRCQYHENLSKISTAKLTFSIYSSDTN